MKLVGSHRVLGAWEVCRAVEMHQLAPHQWVVAVPAEELTVPFEYKFILVSPEGEVHWEQGNNHQWQYLPGRGEGLVLPESEIPFDLPLLRLAGTAIPVFSLRSEQSFGVGDFGDLKRLVDWAVLTHQQAIQILPINDTTMTHRWTDSYPYKAISIYALHPMFIDLNQLGKLADDGKNAGFEQLRVELNALPDVDYERVNQAKWEYVRLKFAEEGAAVLKTEAYRKFFADNEDWLRPYAAFCYLRDKFGTPDFSEWGDYAVYSRKAIEKLAAPGSAAHDEIALITTCSTSSTASC